MDIKEKAKTYAEGKMTEAIEQVIADAYTEGYRDGYKDRSDEIPSAVKKEEDVEFVDLGLPSGTLWSKEFLKDNDGKVLYLTYREAQKYNIPTIEQLKELFEYCSHDRHKGMYDRNVYDFLGVTGECLHIYFSGYYKANGHTYNDQYLWIASSEDNNNIAKAVLLNCWIDKEVNIEDLFIGYKLPVLVVKSE